MDKLWTKRRPPTPLNWEELPDAGIFIKMYLIYQIFFEKYIINFFFFFNEKVAGTSQSEDPGLKDLKIWSIAECAKIFAVSVEKLKIELKKLAEGDHLIWDKDNKEAMDFVAACANIRAHIFGIPQKTRFDVKCL